MTPWASDPTETLGDAKYGSWSSKETVTMSLPQPSSNSPTNLPTSSGSPPGQAHNLWIDDPEGLPAALDDGIPRSLVCAAGECRAALE